MRMVLRRRFWLETALAIVAGILFVITLVRNELPFPKLLKEKSNAAIESNNLHDDRWNRRPS